MRLIILGSGGCQPIPRPCCICKVCVEARKKGMPYSRAGPALFLKDINALFDTPEEIAIELNTFDVKEVDHVFYTHWHPDHVAGMRVFEQLYLDWLADSIGKNHGATKIVNVYANKIIWSEINSIKNKFGSYFGYYASRNLIKRKTLTNNAIKIKDVKITGIFRSVEGANDNVLVYVIEQKGKKAIYAPCDCKPFPDDSRLRNANVLIVWSPYFEGPLKEGFVAGPKNPLREELFSMDEIIKIIQKYKPKQTIITHIEESMGKTYSDLKKLEKKYRKFNIKFAFDGMQINL